MRRFCRKRQNCVSNFYCFVSVIGLQPGGGCSRSLQFSIESSMSISGISLALGGRTAIRAFEFGRTHVVRPKGRHQAIIVWLHGLGDNGASWSQLLETLPLPNIKWICPTAPSRPVTLFGGYPSIAWCDVSDLSEDANDDLEGLDASAAHVASLLSTEPLSNSLLSSSADSKTLHSPSRSKSLKNPSQISDSRSGDKPWIRRPQAQIQ